MAPLAGQPRSSSSSGTSHVYPDLSDQDQLPQHQTDHSRVTTETRNLHTDSSSKVAVCPVWLRSHAIYFAWWQKFILTAQKGHEVLVIRYHSGRRRAGFFRNNEMVQWSHYSRFDPIILVLLLVMSTWNLTDHDAFICCQNCHLYLLW